MLNFCSLYSGSSGNCSLIQTENTNLLIDAGVSSKKIENTLTDLGISPENIDAILVTHEHADHVQGLGTFSKKFDTPVFTNIETLDSMPKQRDKLSSKNINLFKVKEKFSIGDLDIDSFSIPHDAANPCGFNISKDGKKVSIATDIGHMTNDILKKLEESKLVLLESNYVPEVLRCSRYPFILKSRIAGPTGHLSNEAAGKTISRLLPSGLKYALLGHLSKESNFPELAYKTVVDELIESNYDEDSLSLSVANRESPSNFITI